MAAGLQVFGQPASTDVARVLTCLFEKDLEFELVCIDTFKREHKLPEFIKLRDPNGQVTFKHGDKTIVGFEDNVNPMCRFKGYMPDHAVIAENEKKLQQVLNVYDEILSKNEYLAGDEFTLADLSHLPNSHYIVSSERGRKLFTGRKNVARWYDQISKRETWKQVVKMQREHPGAFE
uniref:glutathione transferase n=1 Tax=Oryza sativa subsp. japonica TaxID=39947 RepID=Q8H8D9_ORYSJ|nr:Putative glutathione S-transferase [Oryza sativa Japonica Group]